MTILSANEIRQYCDCPRKRYFSSRSLLGLRSNKRNNPLLLGTTVHKMLQAGYLKEEFQLDEMTADILKETGDHLVYETIRRNYRETFEDDLMKYEAIACEYEFTMKNWPIEGVTYHGQIDMICRRLSDGAIVFFEHKTCRDFRPEIYNRFDIQLHIYDCFGEQYCKANGEVWGGMVLNEIKKAKTDLGYALHRMFYSYSSEERKEFTEWLTRKTIGAVSPNNLHEPCNSYMTCKMCEYAPVCVLYGYELPTSAQEVIDSVPEQMFVQNLRDAEVAE